MRSLRSSALALSVAVTLYPLLAPAPASAQTIPSPYRFIEARHGAGGFVGTLFENRGELRLGPGGGIVFGGRYSFELTGPLAVEATSFVLMTDREVYDPRGGPDSVELLGTTDAYVAGLDGRIRLNLTGARTWNGFAPFLLVGGGVVQDLAGRSEMESAFGSRDRVSFGPGALGILGGGTRWIPTDRVHVRLDTVFSLWKVVTPPSFLPTEAGSEPVPPDEWTATGAVLLGVVIPF